MTKRSERDRVLEAGMQFASATARGDTLGELARGLLAGAEALSPAEIDLAILFVTAPVSSIAASLAEAIRSSLQPRVFLGVSCEGVIGGAEEIERVPGAALWVGSLPGVDLQPFHIGLEEWEGLLGDDERLQQRIGTGERHQGQLLLADPFTTPVEALLPRLDAVLGKPTFGGMASAGQAPGQNVLLLNDQVYTEGAVGLGIGGAVRLDPVVSQGCRPIGEPMVVTKAEGQAILELGRRPALEVAQEMLGRLSEADKALLQNGLLVGVVTNEYQTRFERGDFLVRGLLGVARDSGGLVIGDLVRPGQTVQFHVRDAATAHEDLTELLFPQTLLAPPAGALLFSCNGRGQRMFPEPHHDIHTTLETLPNLPVAGFFAMGELGPVGGKSFMHGHTASLVFFRPADS